MPNPIGLQKALAGADYPADRQQLVDLAKKNNADQDIIEHSAHCPRVRSAARIRSRRLSSSPSGLVPQVIQHRCPIGEPVRTEVDPLALEPLGAIVGPIVDEEVAAIEVLVVGQDEPLVCR